MFGFQWSGNELQRTLIHVDGVYVEISINPNDQYRLWTFVFLIRLTVCKSPSERIQYPSTKTLTSWAQHDTMEETIASKNKRKSLLVIQIELN